jgi:protocatechuate 3,4-dioxygenase beta subunit
VRAQASEPPGGIGSSQARLRAATDTGATATVNGTVFDSVTNAPLADAQVQFVDAADRTRAYSVRADSQGRFHIDSVQPGRYAAGFFHPSLDALGIEPPIRAADVHSGSDNFFQLVIPGPARIMAAVCPAASATDSLGAIGGVVRSAESGLPVQGAKVVVSWYEIVINQHGLTSHQRRVPVSTGENGDYRICGLPGADTVVSSAEAPGRRSGLVEVPVPVGGIVRRDFSLGDSSTAVAVAPDSNASPDVQQKTTVLRGVASLSGLVHGPDGKPMSGAKVVVWGTGLETATHADGRFALSGLPAGTFSVEARALGFEPRHVAVDLSDRTPATVSITFRQHVQQLSRVTVLGKEPSNARSLDDFLRRTHSGMGHYITASDNRLKYAFSISDALRTTPGVQVVPSGSFGHVILMRGHCAPVIYVDGVAAQDGYETLDDLVPPQQVAGMEIYSGLGEAPPQYLSNACGTILVWTKR